ncbi:MAG: phosphoribosyltransferase [Proteobacteria bacterium]|nr:phosphoribosyltransferase [Pseudomonadota bacterium]
MNVITDNIIEYKANHQATGVFVGREHAGKILAGMLESYQGSDAIVLGIPAGGMPVAAVVASELKLELNFIVVKKVTPPDNTEFGYGAIAADGSLRINENLPPRLGLSESEVQHGITIARNKVQQRERMFRQHLPTTRLQGRDVILVDDGLATGVTYQTAIDSLHKQGVNSIIGAIPTAHQQSLTQMAQQLDRIYCANVRAGLRYAVAEAYEQWHDVSDEEVIALLRQTRQAAHA